MHDQNLIKYVSQLLEVTDFVISAHETIVLINNNSQCFFRFIEFTPDSLANKIIEYRNYYDYHDDHNNMTRITYLKLFKHLNPLFTSTIYLGSKYGI